MPPPPAVSNVDDYVQVPSALMAQVLDLQAEDSALDECLLRALACLHTFVHLSCSSARGQTHACTSAALVHTAHCNPPPDDSLPDD